jgi:hypothetical protein
MDNWIKVVHKYLRGGDVIRGDVLHFKHEHPFSYPFVLEKYIKEPWYYERDFKRDANFSLIMVNEDMRKFFKEHYA